MGAVLSSTSTSRSISLRQIFLILCWNRSNQIKRVYGTKTEALTSSASPISQRASKKFVSNHNQQPQHGCGFSQSKGQFCSFPLNVVNLSPGSSQSSLTISPTTLIVESDWIDTASKVQTTCIINSNFSSHCFLR
jgi:hypothetical protein